MSIGRRRFECVTAEEASIAAKKGAKIEVEGGDAEITINGATVKGDGGRGMGRSEAPPKSA